MCLSNVRLPIATINPHFGRSMIWKTIFNPPMCYFPSFPFEIIKQINRILTVTALGCVELVKVLAASGILTVLLIHQSHCVCYTSLWGKEEVLECSFQFWARGRGLSPWLTYAKSILFHGNCPFVGGAAQDQCDGPFPGRVKQDLKKKITVFLSQEWFSHGLLSDTGEGFLFWFSVLFLWKILLKIISLAADFINCRMYFFLLYMMLWCYPYQEQ